MTSVTVDRGTRGKVVVTRNLIEVVRKLSPDWEENWSDAKVAKTLNRALPGHINQEDSVKLQLPGGKAVCIPIMAEAEEKPVRQGHPFSITTFTLFPHPTKEVKPC